MSKTKLGYVICGRCGTEMMRDFHLGVWNHSNCEACGELNEWFVPAHYETPKPANFGWGLVPMMLLIIGAFFMFVGM